LQRRVDRESPDIPEEHIGSTSPYVKQQFRRMLQKIQDAIMKVFKSGIHLELLSTNGKNK
jgi:hypothetical protein